MNVYLETLGVMATKALVKCYGCKPRAQSSFVHLCSCCPKGGQGQKERRRIKANSKIRQRKELLRYSCFHLWKGELYSSAYPLSCKIGCGK